MILGAYYLLWMLQRVVFGPLREPHGHGHGHDDGHGTATRGDPPGRLARDRRPDAADGPDRRDRRLSRGRSSTGSGPSVAPIAARFPSPNGPMARPASASGARLRRRPRVPRP